MRTPTKSDPCWDWPVAFALWLERPPSVTGPNACDLIGALYCTVSVLSGSGVGDAPTLDEEYKMENQSVQNEVILVVDTHLDTHVAAVISHTGQLLGTLAMPTSAAGYLKLLKWARSWGCVRRAGLEGTGTYGGLA
jgi:hypothetical protein